MIESISSDIRWLQRFDNYKKALVKFREGIDLLEFTEKQSYPHKVVEALCESLVQRFEYTFELAWNLMKDYAIYQGHKEIRGPLDAIRTAMHIELIEQGDVWIEMMNDRNKMSHTYDETKAAEVVEKIRFKFACVLFELEETVDQIASQK